MPFDTNFLPFLNQNIQWYPFTGLDSQGNPTYASVYTLVPSLYERAVTRSGIGRVSTYGAGTGTGTTGSESAEYLLTPVSSYTIYCPPQTPEIQPRDKLVLPTGAVIFVEQVTEFADPVFGDPGFVELSASEYR